MTCFPCYPVHAEEYVDSPDEVVIISPSVTDLFTNEDNNVSYIKKDLLENDESTIEIRSDKKNVKTPSISSQKETEKEQNNAVLKKEMKKEETETKDESKDEIEDKEKEEEITIQKFSSSDEGKDAEKDQNDTQNEVSKSNAGSIGIELSSDLIRKDKKGQTYTVSYSGDANHYKKESMTFFFDNGFHIDSIDYDKVFDNNIKILAFGYDGSSSDNPSSIGTVQKLVLSAENAENNDIENLQIRGTYHTDLIANSFNMKTSFEGELEDGNTNYVETSKDTDHLYYHYDTPIITCSSNELAYQSPTTITVSNINGYGNETCKSYQIVWSFPRNIHIQAIDYPEYDGADCEIMVNSQTPQPKDGTIRPNTTGRIILKITPTSDHFTQTKDMVMSVQNITDAERSIEVIGKGNVSYEKLSTDRFSASPISLHLFPEVEIIPDEPEPSSEPEPESPSEPVIPSEPEPEKESTPSKETENQTNSTTAAQSTSTVPTATEIKRQPVEEVEVKGPQDKKEPKKVENKKTTNPVTKILKDTGASNLLDNTNSLIDSVGTGLISSAVEDVDTDSKTPDKDTGSVITPEIEEDGKEQISKEVKKKVKENRSIQLFIGFAVVLGVAIAGLAVFIKKMSKDEVAQIEADAKAKEKEAKDKKDIEIAEKQKEKLEKEKEISSD